MLAPNLKLCYQMFIPLGTSLALETMQYVLAIGSSDITDVITNSAGGTIGIFLYAILRKVLKSKEKADVVVLIVAGIVTILFLGIISFLLLSN